MNTDVCWAGRWAFNEGRWPKIPCPNAPVHMIGVDDDGAAIVIALCDDHFKDVLAQGLISEPYPDQAAAQVRLEEIRRRQREK